MACRQGLKVLRLSQPSLCQSFHPQDEQTLMLDLEPKRSETKERTTSIFLIPRGLFVIYTTWVQQSYEELGGKGAQKTILLNFDCFFSWAELISSLARIQALFMATVLSLLCQATQTKRTQQKRTNQAFLHLSFYENKLLKLCAHSSMLWD